MGMSEPSLRADVEKLRNDVAVFDCASTDFLIARLGVDTTMPGRREWMKVAERLYGPAWSPAEALMVDLAKLVRRRPPAPLAKVIDLQSRRAACRAAKAGG